MASARAARAQASHGRVVGIAQRRLFNGRGFDALGDLAIACDDLGGREIFLPEFGGELRAPEDAGELREERLGSEAFEAAFAGEIDQSLGRAAPKERRGDDVGVKNDTHGPREARRAPPLVRIRVRLR